MNKTKLLVFLLILALAIVACDTEEPEPTATAVPEQLEQLAIEPAPASPLESMEFVVDEDLINVTWEWEQRTSNLGEEVLITVPDPAKLLKI